MTAYDQWKQTTSDPLGLRQLPQIEPGYDGWDRIAGELNAVKDTRQRWRRAGGWLAVAASLVLIISISLRTTTEAPAPGQKPVQLATQSNEAASISMNDNVAALIGLSQSMAEQLKRLREETGVMPAESAIYVAELEDLIAQVDNELNLTPDSIDLWGQRVNLMLDLAQIYQQQWEIDYGRMASL
jgi:hypothetical protein